MTCAYVCINLALLGVNPIRFYREHTDDAKNEKEISKAGRGLFASSSEEDESLMLNMQFRKFVN